MRFSLREFLLIAGVASLGAPALVYASPLVVGVCWLAMTAATVLLLVNAILLTASPRAYAVGFLCASLVYVGVLHVTTERGLADPYTGKFLPSRLMQRPFEWVRKQRNYFIDADGQKVREPPEGVTIRGRSIRISNRAVSYQSHIRLNDFMAVANCLWTLLFGCLGGKYAVWVYRRRLSEESAP